MVKSGPAVADWAKAHPTAATGSRKLGDLQVTLPALDAAASWKAHPKLANSGAINDRSAPKREGTAGVDLPQAASLAASTVSSTYSDLGAEEARRWQAYANLGKSLHDKHEKALAPPANTTTPPPSEHNQTTADLLRSRLAALEADWDRAAVMIAAAETTADAEMPAAAKAKAKEWARRAAEREEAAKRAALSAAEERFLVAAAHAQAAAEGAMKVAAAGVMALKERVASAHNSGKTGVTLVSSAGVFGSELFGSDMD